MRRSPLPRMASPALLAALLACPALPSPAGPHSGCPVRVECTNPGTAPRTDAPVAIPLASVKKVHTEFTAANFAVLSDGKALAAQTGDTDADGRPDEILVLLDLAGGETRLLELHSPPPPGLPAAPARPRAQADLMVKTDYTLRDGVYAGGRFVGANAATTPAGHRSHNAYFKYEGPGWESDRIAYRLYLDERNRCDIFGKLVPDLVLHTVGVNDLVSDGKESYTVMQPWGRDIYKVASTLGIGSFALWHDGRPAPVERYDSASCRIVENGPLRAAIVVGYRGWVVDGRKRDLDVRLSIAGGSRVTRVELRATGPAADFCTGVAAHPGSETILAPPEGKEPWAYAARYGLQTLTGDRLGTAVFYRRAELVATAEDSLNRTLALRPSGGAVTYHACAAWEKEPGGITNESDFRSYLDRTARELSSPVRVKVR